MSPAKPRKPATGPASASPPTQHVRTGHCPHCRLVVLMVDAEESRPSFLVDTRLVDPTPLDQAAQMACIVTRRPTWAYVCQWGVERLDLRNLGWWMCHTDDPHDAILPEHQCGARFATALHRPRTRAPAPAQSKPAQSHHPDLFEAAEAATAARKELAECPF